MSAHGRIRTCTWPILSRLSLLLDYTGMKLALPEGLSPPASAFEARRSIH